MGPVVTGVLDVNRERRLARFTTAPLCCILDAPVGILASGLFPTPDMGLISSRTAGRRAR